MAIRGKASKKTQFAIPIETCAYSLTEGQKTEIRNKIDTVARKDQFPQDMGGLCAPE